MSAQRVFRIVSQENKTTRLAIPPIFRIQYKTGKDTRWYFHEIVPPVPVGDTCTYERKPIPWQSTDIREVKEELQRLGRQYEDEEWIPINHYILNKI